MYRIRFHGRGGQGMKTASRILGSALFNAGFEIQDAPRYGAERRGAPIFAYVRADHKAINERGIITNPDLIIVADDTLIPIPSVNLLHGAQPSTLMLIYTNLSAETWQHRLNFPGQILTLATGRQDDGQPETRYLGVICAAGGAALIDELQWQHLEEALNSELAGLGEDILAKNLEYASLAYNALTGAAKVRTGKPVCAPEAQAPEWVDLAFAPAHISAPAIHAAATSVEVRTGLWRTRRPVIARDICHHCWWICSTYCPDGAIQVDSDNSPRIDYDHCKGCMVCLSQCPHHAISAVPEQEFRDQETGAPS